MRTVNPIEVDGRAERGIALLLVIFGLLLLTAVTAAMLFSSNTETNIATNFRDKSISNYAVTSGLQEARDRIQPVSGDLGIGKYVPTDMPGAAKGQVLYIINPLAGENVAPWDPKNAYADTELCQEANMAALGVAVNTPGAPCATNQIPSPHKCDLVGTAPSNWCTYTTAWPQGTPLDYKWVRITLKADNSTPVWVTTPGNNAVGTEVCWDSNLHQQLQKPTSAGIDCLGANSGSPVQSVTLNTNGVGYTSTPTVTFLGGGGGGAAATAVVTATSGGIQSTTLSNKGSGYTSAPTVSLVSPDGSGASFSALINGSPVTGLSMGTTNYCYSNGTTGLGLAFIPTPPPTAGGSATASVTMTSPNSCVISATINASCGKSMKGTPLTVSLSGGFSATFTLNNQGSYSGPVKPTSVGSYSGTIPAPQSATVSGCTFPITSLTGGIKIASVSLTNSGGEYVVAPTATVQGTPPVAPNTAQPPVSVAWSAGANNGQLNSISVATTGSGYAQASYTLNITGGGGSGAVGTATSGATKHVTGIALTSGGSGYTSPPQVVIGGPGSGASATAILQGGQKLLYGRVYLLTAMSQTQGGTTSMGQMEVGVAPPWNFQLGGALTIAGPTPTFGTPNSNIFHINGSDAAGTGTEPSSCNNTPANPLPAIGVYDTSAQSCIVSGGATCGGGLGKQNNYTGAQSAPDVYVTAAANPDPGELQTMVDDISSTPGAQLVAGPATNSSVTNWGTATNLQTVVINGDLTLSGNPSGYGVLIVTGNLTMNGDFTWHGVVLVLGAAIVNNQGGGNGQITGAFYVANDQGSSLGSATFNWNGGGGNGVQYDHCWADDLLNKYPSTASDKALQVLSTRMLQF